MMATAHTCSKTHQFFFGGSWGIDTATCNSTEGTKHFGAFWDTLSFTLQPLPSILHTSSYNFIEEVRVRPKLNTEAQPCLFLYLITILHTEKFSSPHLLSLSLGLNSPRCYNQMPHNKNTSSPTRYLTAPLPSYCVTFRLANEFFQKMSSNPSQYQTQSPKCFWTFILLKTIGSNK